MLYHKDQNPIERSTMFQAKVGQTISVTWLIMLRHSLVSEDSIQYIKSQLCIQWQCLPPCVTPRFDLNISI